MVRDVAIIGGGPAGLTAGIYASRGGLDTVLIEGNFIGGQIALSHNVENYSGYQSINGFELTEKMRQQAESTGVEFVYDEVKAVSLDGDIKTISLVSNETILAKAVIICTGAKPKKLDNPREDELIGGGISYCATCDGAFFKKKNVAVIGGGNTAVTDALYLKKFANNVYLIHRREGFRADKILVERAKSSGIIFVLDSVLKELIGTPLSQITVTNVKDNSENVLDIEGLFVAIGLSPNSILFDGILEMQDGYIKTNEEMETNIKGVYACGDVRIKNLRQVITACADGAVAAENVVKVGF